MKEDWLKFYKNNCENFHIFSTSDKFNYNFCEWEILYKNSEGAILMEINLIIL